MNGGLAYYPVENPALFAFTGYLPHVMFCGLTIGHVRYQWIMTAWDSSRNILPRIKDSLFRPPDMSHLFLNSRRPGMSKSSVRLFLKSTVRRKHRHREKRIKFDTISDCWLRHTIRSTAVSIICPSVECGRQTLNSTMDMVVEQNKIRQHRKIVILQ